MHLPKQGIYTLGYNAKTITKLATVVLYKDISAHVALATICRDRADSEVIGDVTYKPVHSMNPFDLKNPEDMAMFASVFIATLKTTIF